MYADADRGRPWVALALLLLAAALAPHAARADAGDVGQLQLSKMRWGATGDFAGFTGLWLAAKDCSSLFDASNKALYRNQTEYDAAKQLSAWQSGKLKADTVAVMASTYNILNGVTMLINTIIAVTTRLQAGITETTCIAQQKAVAAGETTDEFGNEVAPLRPLINVGSSSLPRDSWIGLAEEAYDKANNFYAKYEASKFSKGSSGRLRFSWAPVLMFIRSSLQQFVSPLKQFGTVLELVGMTAGYPNLQRGGRGLRKLFTSPEKNLNKAYRKISQLCNQMLDIAQQGERAREISDRLSKIVGLVKTVAVIPASYDLCAKADGAVKGAISEVRSKTGSVTGKRRSLLYAEEDKVMSADEMLQEAQDLRQAVEDFRNRTANAMLALNQTIMPALLAASALSDQLANLTLEISGLMGDLDDWSGSVPPIVMDISVRVSNIFGPFATNFCSGSAASVDPVCATIALATKLVNALMDAAMRAMKLDPNLLEASLIEMLELGGVPIPDWFSIGFDFDWPDLDAYNPLASFEAPLNATIDAIGNELTDLATKLFGQLSGTKSYDLTSDPSATIRKRLAFTPDSSISVRCPEAWTSYTTALLLQQPDCSADYTAWGRFPCGNTTCKLNWSAFNWRCQQEPPVFPFVGLSSRLVVMLYDCVAPSALSSYKLLPEMLSVSKSGATTLQQVTYQGTKVNSLPTARALAAFNLRVGLGNFNLPQLSNIHGPGLTSGAAGPSGSRAAPPWATVHEGRLDFPLVDNFFQSSSQPLSIGCKNSAPFGLPMLLIDGIDSSPCYDLGLWRNALSNYPDTSRLQGLGGFAAFRQMYIDDMEQLRSDMCGWRMAARRGFVTGPDKIINQTLASMVPPMALPWSKPPTDVEFADFWLRRGACEFFDGGSRSARSHLPYSDWPLQPLPSVAACAAALKGPDCQLSQSDAGAVVCDIAAQGADWPLVAPTSDPWLKSDLIPASVCPTSPPQGDGDGHSLAYYPCVESAVPRTSAYCVVRDPVANDGTTPDVIPLTADYEHPNSRLLFYSSATLSTASKLTAAAQWATECSLNYYRDLEFQARQLLHNKFLQRGSTLNPACLALLDACRASPREDCDIKAVFQCDELLGVVQYACVGTHDASGTGGSGQQVTLVFADSLVSNTKVLRCSGAHEQLAIASAELGQGRAIKDVLETVITKLCLTDGSSCTLDMAKAELGAVPGDALRVISTCTCAPGYERDGNSTTAPCMPCAAGWYRSATMPACSEVPAGSFSGTGAAAPVNCSAGSFSTSSGAAICTECPQGWYSSVVGATSGAVCRQCDLSRNEYTNGTGAAACQVCAPGTMLTFTTATNSSSVGQGFVCRPCDAGSFRTAGMRKCELCPPGSLALLPGATNCSAAPVGSFVQDAGAYSVFPCLPGTYSDQPGATQCTSCPDGYTSPLGASSSADCRPATLLTGADLTRLRALADATGPSACSALVAAMAAVSGYNASLLMTEVGDSNCNQDWRNGAACQYDRGDCCKQTCVPQCIQASSAEDDMVPTYLALGGSCSDSSFQCRDPAALALNASSPAAQNCSGTRLTASTLLQRLLLPVLVSDPPLAVRVLVAEANVNVPAAGNSSGAPASGNCSSLTCLDTSLQRGLNDSSSAADTQAPYIRPPPGYSVACGATLVMDTNFTAFDDVDGALRLAAPSLAVSATGLLVAIGAPLPCSGTLYKVTLTWTATDKAGNTARASQVITVPPPRYCPGPLPAVLNGIFPTSCLANATTGSVCQAVCRVGYTPSGGASALCTGDGSWQVSGYCKRACPGSPTPTPNVTWPQSCRDATEILAWCFGQCPPSAPFGSPRSQCTGSWATSPVIGACRPVPVCRTMPPSVPANSVVSCYDTPINGTCVATCASGYRARPAPVARCTTSGWSAWTPTQCYFG